VVEHLATALESWGTAYPEAKPIKLGEFSKRGGGRLKPHSSHRTGRDVDIGYVVHNPTDGPRFRRVTEENLDAEATWGLVHSLISTGSIEYIFMNAYVQRMLLPHAEQELPPEELARWFSVAADGYAAQNRAIVKHWRGHDDHMHVRFACSPTDVGCREAKRRKKKRGRR
jgi:murein endopeptidase